MNLKDKIFLFIVVGFLVGGSYIWYTYTEITERIIQMEIEHETHIDQVNKEFRKDNIEKFKKSKIQILFNNEVLTQGFDAPSVDVVFIARPTKSPILLLQMIGRGMRGKNVGGTEKFDLYYVRDSIFDDFSNLDELFEIFHENYGEKWQN